MAWHGPQAVWESHANVYRAEEWMRGPWGGSSTQLITATSPYQQLQTGSLQQNAFSRGLHVSDALALSLIYFLPGLSHSLASFWHQFTHPTLWPSGNRLPVAGCRVRMQPQVYASVGDSESAMAPERQLPAWKGAQRGGRNHVFLATTPPLARKVWHECVPSCMQPPPHAAQPWLWCSCQPSWRSWCWMASSLPWSLVRYRTAA